MSAALDEYRAAWAEARELSIRFQAAADRVTAAHDALTNAEQREVAIERIKQMKDHFGLKGPEGEPES